MTSQVVSQLAVQSGWQTRRVFVTVKAYPNPSARYRETVCVAGITESGQWIRLYPIPYRYLEYDQQFPTYSWISARVQKSSGDARPESFKVDVDSIAVTSRVGTQDNWHERRTRVLPLLAPSLEALRRHNQESKVSLGLIRPRRVTRLIIRNSGSQWSEKELAKLQQTSLFDPQTQDGTYQAWRTLEKIPYHIKYHFYCDDDLCRGHMCRVISWEVMQSIRKWKSKYGNEWETKFRQKYENQFLGDDVDLHFFMGTVHSHRFPNAWVIIGLFYPPALSRLSAVQPSLF